MGFDQVVIFSLLVVLIICPNGVIGVSFTFLNKCEGTIWPGILGTPSLGSTGFELVKGSSRSFQAPTGWSGRFWGRTGCNFDDSGKGSCSSGDCNSGQLECNGAGATPPATLAEFTLGSGSLDFYDVSLVDGYNLPMLVEVKGGSRSGSGSCASTGCTVDLNQKCPAELRVESGDACRSACEAFGTEQYCCKGAYASPSTCAPTVYSQIFKSACPKSYSYAYDDSTSTFTCTAADYTITFCPNSTASQRTSKPEGSTEGSGSGAWPNPDMGSGVWPNSDPDSGSGSGSMEAMLANGSWLADLATGGAPIRRRPNSYVQFLVLFTVFLFQNLLIKQ